MSCNCYVNRRGCWSESYVKIGNWGWYGNFTTRNRRKSWCSDLYPIGASESIPAVATVRASELRVNRWINQSRVLSDNFELPRSLVQLLQSDRCSLYRITGHDVIDDPTRINEYCESYCSAAGIYRISDSG